MAVPIVILALFATIWGLVGQSFAGAATPWLALPVAISALLFAWAMPAARSQPIGVPNPRRVVAIWSTIELALMALVFVLLKRAGLHHLITPALAAIVGAHFIPLARGLKIRVYDFTGAGLIAIGLISLTLPSATSGIVSGWGAALVLWATVGIIGYSARRARAGKTVGKPQELI